MVVEEIFKKIPINQLKIRINGAFVKKSAIHQC